MEKAGYLRLLAEQDSGSSLIGWKPTTSGLGGLINARGWAMLRVVVQKMVDGKLKDLYDQPIIVENAGAIVAVCYEKNYVALLQNFRFTAERLSDVGFDYVKRLNEDKRWDELAASLGEWQWELPRGLVQAQNFDDLESYIVNCAKLETMEELGLMVDNAKICGRINANTTFFTHSQYVVSGRVVAKTERKPEPEEILGKVKFFSAAELRQMTDNGELTDGITLGALSLARFAF